ncbi:hypothetical protein LTS10_002747 [Elasticomyces elasticus]|nr:hypothetical protein LTS10_002747 [Elasticomyces elasticus]
MADTRLLPSEHGPFQCLTSSLTVAEVQDIETENILCVTCSRIDSYGTAWFGQISGVRKYDLSDADLWGLLKPLPDEQLYPMAPPGLDVHEHKDTDGRYIKRANLVGSEDAEVAKILPMIVLEKAKILHSLEQRPHPNLVGFYGCILKDNRIAGLVLEKYPRTLEQYFHQDHSDFNHFKAQTLMEGLRAGVKHLHSLGLAHNDLKPMNVALEEKGNLVIIDLGSCRQV